MAYEVDLPANALSESKYFSIDENSVIYHDTQMEIADINGIAYARYIRKTNTGLSAMQMKISTVYVLRLRDTSGDEMKVEMVVGTLMGDEAAMDVIWQQMMFHCWEYIVKKLVDQIYLTLHAGKNYQLEKYTLTPGGIKTVHNSFMGAPTEYTIRWEDLNYVDGDVGLLRMYSIREPNATIEFQVNLHYNGEVLRTWVNFLLADRNNLRLLYQKNNIV
jgi:hypothetical protein